MNNRIAMKVAKRSGVKFKLFRKIGKITHERCALQAGLTYPEKCRKRQIHRLMYKRIKKGY